MITVLIALFSVGLGVGLARVTSRPRRDPLGIAHLLNQEGNR